MLTPTRRVATVLTALACAAVSGGVAAPRARADNNSTAILPKDRFRFEFISVGNNFKTDGHTAIGLIYGLGPDKPVPFGRWEVGFEYLISAGPFAGSFTPKATDPTNAPAGAPISPISTRQRVFFNFKTQLYDNPLRGERVTIGAYLIGDEEAHAGNLGFLAFSKQFGKHYTHVGWVHSFSNRRVRATPSGTADRDYFQLDYAYPVMPRLIAGFNYYHGKGNPGVFFPAIIYFLTPTYDSSITLGDFRWNDSSVKPTRDQVYLQFDYYWDRVPKPPMQMPPQPAPSSSGVGP